MPTLPDPSWIVIAKKYLGLSEIKGPHHNPHILEWWKDIGAPFRDDETPWCGAYVGGVLVEDGRKPVKGAASARNWLNLPVHLDKPAVGCVVILWRGDKQGQAGHVFFLLGQDKNGNLVGIGGNQSDKVTIAAFSRSRVLGYRWPGIFPYQERFKLPVIDLKGKPLSKNEA